MARNEVCITMLMHKGRMTVWVCGVTVSRVYAVCYSTQHGLMSQAKDDYEGFLMAQEKKKVSVHVQTSLSV